MVGRFSSLKSLQSVDKVYCSIRVVWGCALEYDCLEMAKVHFFDSLRKD